MAMPSIEFLFIFLFQFFLCEKGPSVVLSLNMGRKHLLKKKKSEISTPIEEGDQDSVSCEEATSKLPLQAMAQGVLSTRVPIRLTPPIEEGDQDDKCRMYVDDIVDMSHESFDEEEAEKEEVDEEEKPPKGACELCYSTRKRLTAHHLVPKLIIRRLKKTKLHRKDDEVNPKYAWICRDCHSTLHRMFDHKELAVKLSSLDTLRECEELQPYLEWKRKHG
jgi:hypothetical protein